MSQNPNPSLLDPGQIVKRAFNETDDRLRVDAEITATIVGPQEVVISAADDSIRIEDISGNALAIEPDGSINVNAAINITGVSTAAKQDTGNISLASIDSKLTSPITVTGPLTDTQLRATPVPVSGTVTITDGSGPVTVDGTVAVTNLDVALSTRLKPADTLTAVTTVGTITNVVHVDDNSSSLTVDNTGTFAVQAAQAGTWDVTNVSGTVSLPTGASTSTKQDTGNTSLSSIDDKLTNTTSQVFGPTTGSTNLVLFTLDAAGWGGAYLSFDSSLVSGVGAFSAELSIEYRNNTTDAWSLDGTGLRQQDGSIIGSVIYLTADGVNTATSYGTLIYWPKSRYVRGRLSFYDNFNGDSNYTTNVVYTKVAPTITTPRGQALSESSIPVVIASDQTTIPISATSLPLPTGAATSALQTQPGVDIGDVTINNSTGASAVNIQDGGNSITVDGSLTNISGTISLPTGASTENTLAKLTQTQGSTTNTQSGPLIQGAVTTSVPSYTTAQTSPLSLNVSGGLRIDGSAVTQPISAVSLPLPTSASTDASVTNVQGSATGGTAAIKSTLIGGIYNDPPILIIPGQQGSIQLDSNSRVLVSLPQTRTEVELLQELILETRAMRMALVALVTEGQRNTPEDFDPQVQNYTNTLQ